MKTDKVTENYQLALKSVYSLLDQCSQAWEESTQVINASTCPVFDKMVICGMGGSALPAYIINSMFSVSTPLIVVEGYELPNWVDKNTLVILSSYSGNTEETLSCARSAKKLGCKMLGITSGGQLAKLLQSWGVTCYIFNPINNPSNLPRFGLGYGIFGLLGLMFKCHMFNVPSDADFNDEVEQALTFVRENTDHISEKAQGMIAELKDKMLIVFSGNHLEGNGKVFAAQLNETSKILAFCADLPDADHNLIEGFLKSKENVCALFIKSKMYMERIRERFDITEEIIKKDGFRTYSFQPQGKSQLTEMLEVLYFSSIFSVLLSKENNVDPLSIPAVEFIKSQLLLLNDN